MTITISVASVKTAIKREWTQFAPQLVAFVAAGVPTTVVVAVLAAVGIHIPMTLAVLLSGGVASVAAYIQKDDLLKDSAKQLAGKLAAFIVSGLTAATVIAVLSTLHVPIPGWLASALPIVLGIVSGYFKSDTVTTTPPATT